jgi:hypothetical protein
MTNKQFAAKDRVFVKACEIAKVEPTARQAAKFQNKKGLARRFYGSASSAVKRQETK